MFKIPAVPSTMFCGHFFDKILCDCISQSIFHGKKIFFFQVAIGAICLSVRLLSTLGSGDLNCIILAVEYENKSHSDLANYSAGGTLGLINYANVHPECISSVFNWYLEYLPYIMLIQTLILVITEKFTFRIPRIAQRVERFYKVCYIILTFFIISQKSNFSFAEHCRRISFR